MDELSNIIYGVWRLEGLTSDIIYQNLCKMKELGINTIDTADIYHVNEYGDSERLIGESLNKDETLKEYFKIVTKCGICLNDGIKDVKYYDNTYEYIVNSALKSKENLQIDKIELFLLHRPSIFMNYDEVYQAFKYLKDNNIVENFGVSNYKPLQFESLYNYLEKRDIILQTNQVEINPLTVEHFKNDNIYYLKGKEITPMIWSPMAGGKLFGENSKVNVVKNKLDELAKKYEVDVTNIIVAYLNSMGLNSKIILGTHKIERYEIIFKNLQLRLLPSEMFEILESFTQEEVL